MVAALVLAACGGDDDADTGAATSQTTGPGTVEPTDLETTEPTVASAEPLVVGSVLPETGPLSDLGPSMIGSVRLAVEDINAAGGVLGEDVDLIERDAGPTTESARASVLELLDERASAIVGAAFSEHTLAFLDVLSDNAIPGCSGSNTFPELTDDPDADFYFRTVPPVAAEPPVLAGRVAGDGHATAAIVSQHFDFALLYTGLVEDSLVDHDVTVTATAIYGPGFGTLGAALDDVVGSSPDAVVAVLPGFESPGPDVATILARGIAPTTVYGSGDLFDPTLPAAVDPSNPNVIDGLTVVAPAGTRSFNERLGPITGNHFSYGGQYYDCVVVTALAAEAAGTVDGVDIMANVRDVTDGGTKCTTFAECAELLDEGEDIDYEGVGGGIALNADGDPTEGRFAVGQFQNGELTVIGAVDDRELTFEQAEVEEN